ncbi:hypothetical protein, partial [Pseudomonas aeruginosa]
EGRDKRGDTAGREHETQEWGESATAGEEGGGTTVKSHREEPIPEASEDEHDLEERGTNTRGDTRTGREWR